jgi:glycosyltransferase involved in cell wall biosynthesis
LKRKVMFVVNADTFFMSHRLPIAQAALEEGFEVHVATRLTSCMDKMQSLGLIVHALDMDRRSAGIFSNGRCFFQILRVFIKVRPDLVHLVTIKPVIFGGVAARLAAVPCVLAAISGLGFVFISSGFKAKIRRWLAVWFYRFALSHKCLKVIFQNADDRNILIRLTCLSKEKTELIRGSGVDLANYFSTPFPEGKPVVILASRLLADKGVREFVQAARALNKNGNIARFILAGKPDPGNPRTVTYDELKKWLSEEVIEWWGHREDMPTVFAASFIVVLPSYYGEGLPKVLIEAAACGRAVITTDHTGCRDAIEPEVTGILVPVRDSLALEGAIKRLLDDPSLCKKMGVAGRKLAEHSFDVRQVASRHICIYDELLLRTSS